MRNLVHIIIMAVVYVSLPTIVEAKDVYLKSGESFSFADTVVHCSGSGGGSGYTQVSKLDLNCLATNYDNYNGYPDWQTVILWAKSVCRTFPMDQPNCNIAGKVYKKAYYDDLMNSHSGTGYPTPQEQTEVMEASWDITYSCTQ